MNVLPSIVSGASELYNLYRNYKNDNSKSLGISKKEARMIGHYNKNGKKLAIYHG